MKLVMSRDINPRKVILGGIVGGILGCVFVIMAIQSNMQTMSSSAASAQSGFSEILTIFGLLAGGFLAGYISAKNEKETWGTAISASVISGILVATFLVGTTLFTNESALATIIQSVDDISGYILYLGVFSVILTVVSTVGGIAFALVAGSKKSLIAKTIKETVKKYKANLVIPIFIFLSLSLLSQAIPLFVDQGQNEYVIYSIYGISIIASIAFLALAYNVSINSAKKSSNISQAFRESTNNIGKIFSGVLLLWVVAPMALSIGISLLGIKILENTTSLGLFIGFLFGLAVLVALYFFLASFTPQAIRSEGSLVKGTRQGFSFVKKNFFMVVSMYALLATMTIAIAVILVAALSLLGEGGVLGEVIWAGTLMLMLTFSIESQTLLYFNLTKGGFK
ncbi:MAG: hypothetical protein J7L23_01600 [Candidatus Diapherotrites archaeon]|nr:hypothetical protein [Candidatus Diapherotrites archaeon]